MNGFEQSRNSGSRFQVPQIAFYGTDGQRVPPLAGHTEGAADRLHFYGITYHRTGAVGFDIRDGFGVDAGSRVGILQQSPLRLAAGYGQAALVAIAIDRRMGHHRQNAISVPAGAIMVLQHKQPAPLRTGITIRGRIKGPTTTSGRQHGRLGKNNEPKRMQMQIDGTGQGQIALTMQNGLTGLMKGHEG